jgi:hypothetical protein
MFSTVVMLTFASIVLRRQGVRIVVESFVSARTFDLTHDQTFDERTVLEVRVSLNNPDLPHRFSKEHQEACKSKITLSQ